jgi:CRP/FNR family transcriptional regulator, cyclic AMP receptor protein
VRVTTITHCWKHLAVSAMGADIVSGDFAVSNAGAMATAFGCDADLATVIAAKARYRGYPARTTIIDAATHERTIFVMVDGHARAVAFSIDGRLVVLQDFGPGDLFGENSLTDGQNSNADVTAIDAVQAGLFESEVFIAMMTNYSVVALAFSRLIVERLHDTARRLVEGATLSATGRVHAELLRQARSGDAMTIRPAPVLSVFALRAQTTRETASRAINALQKRGIVERDDHSLRVVAPHRLEELIY